MLTCHSSLQSTVTLLCNDEILELSSTPASSQACSHVSPGDGDDHEDGHEEGPQPWVAADNGGSDIPVAVGIFVATVVGTPVKNICQIFLLLLVRWPWTHGQHTYIYSSCVLEIRFFSPLASSWACSLGSLVAPWATPRAKCSQITSKGQISS